LITEVGRGMILKEELEGLLRQMEVV